MQWGSLPGMVVFDDGWSAWTYIYEPWGVFRATDPQGMVHTYPMPFDLMNWSDALDVDMEVDDNQGERTGFWVRVHADDPSGTVRIGRLIGD
jgi:hypothetical protein